MTKMLQFLSLAVASLVLSACGGGSDASSALNPPETATATLSINTSGSGMVTSSPAGIDCGSVCSEVVEAGASVTLSAVPAAGYQFAGWSGSAVNCAGTGDCTLTVAADSSVTATFSPQGASQYALNLSISGSGSVTSDIGGLNCSTDCGGTFVTGTLVTLTARPAIGYAFTGWSGNGISCSGTTCRVPMSSARSVTATFNLIPPVTYQLDVAISPSAKGSVGSLPVGIVCGSTCSAKFYSGAVVTLAATPEAGYQFSGWTGAGCSGTGTCVITMSAARSVTAVFAVVPVNTYAFNVAVSGSGTVSSTPAGLSCPTTCSNTFAQGTSVTVTATPAAGYRFAGWSGAGCPTGTSTCTVTMTAATTVGATFTQITYALSVTKQGTGVGTVTSAPAGISCGTTCSASYTTGASVVLTAAPASGSTFGGWSGACTGTATTCTVAMSAVKAVSATFTVNQTYVLTVTASGFGSVGSSPAGISCGSTCAATFSSGASVTLNSSADAGYAFAGWTGACSGTGSCSVSMTAAKTVGASFAVAVVTPSNSVAQGATQVDVCTSAMVGTHATYNVNSDAEAASVPWGTLVAGDVVNIFRKSTPYKFKVGIRGIGTQAAPIVVNGVTDASCNRPVLDFNGSRTVATSANVFSSTLAYGENLGGIVIMRGPSDVWNGPKPAWIAIKNLELRGAATGNSYTSISGATGSLNDGGNIYIHVGSDITIDNVISTDAAFGVFVMAKGGDLLFAGERITLRNSRVYGNGVVGSYYQHNVYMQSASPLVEGNYFGKLRANAEGSSYKSRSSAEIFRNNYVVASARAIDMVQSEENETGIAAQPGYSTDYVHNNTIISDGPECIHYGGDNRGEQGAETTIFVPSVPYRKHLYFWNNTCVQTSSNWYAKVFGLSEKATVVEAWGNSFTLTYTGGGQLSWVEYAGQVKLGSNTVTGATPIVARTGVINDGRYGVTIGNPVPSLPAGL